METNLPEDFELEGPWEEVDGEAVDADAAGDDSAASPAPSPPPAAPPQFRYNERLYAFGFTSSGKSEILNLLFSGITCQRLMIDNKPEFSIDGVEPVSDPEMIDWREQTIHYQPAPGSDSTQYEQIFADAFTRRGLVILVHEWGAIVDYSPQRAGRWLISYVAQGQRLGLGLLAGSTRPKLIPTAGITEASHLLVFGGSFGKKDDMDAAAEALSPVNGEPLSSYELARELGTLQQEQGQFGFLWKDRVRGTLHAMPPIPEHLRRLSVVRRVEDA